MWSFTCENERRTRERNGERGKENLRERERERERQRKREKTYCAGMREARTASSLFKKEMALTVPSETRDWL